MTLSKEATSAIEKLKETHTQELANALKARDEALLLLKEERYQSSINRQALIDDLMTLAVLVQHGLADIHQVKNLDASIDRSMLSAAVKQLEAIESITKDYL